MTRDLDRPLWTDQRPWFEVWFAVVIDEQKRRAAWIRQTLFVPKTGPGRATIWAAWFDADAQPTARARKRILPASAVRAGEGDVLVHHDDCWLGRRGAEGHTAELAWQLAWTGGTTEAAPLPSWLPAPTHAKPILHDADASGEMTVDGVVHALRGRALVMRLYGKRRLPTLQWIWAPWLGDSALEMTAASLRDRFALGLAELRVDGPRPLRGRPASAAHPGGLVTATIAGPQRLVHARAWAEPEAMVGYAYRDTDDRDLMVAQSDSGSAQLEIWTRKLPGSPWHLTDEKRSAGGVAVEIHQHEALPGVTYVPWDGLSFDSGSAPPTVSAAAARGDSIEAPAAGGPAAADAEHVAWPELGAIVALGLTYADHIRETGGTPSADAPLVAFAKHARTFIRDDGAYPISVLAPTVAEITAAAGALEPDLAGRIAGMPGVLDYEGELALVALGPIDVVALAAGTPQPFGLAAANDLTARLVQALGEGMPAPYDYWAAAKSFPRFCPVAPRVWAPAGGLAAIPALTIETRVNGERRQHASTSELIYGLPALVRAAQVQLGRPLVRGDVVLTGTPAGIGMRMSPLQRRVAARITDRFRKAELLVSSYASSSSLLRPGDVVEVSCGRAGTVRARLVV